MVQAFGIQVSKSFAHSAWLKIIVEKILIDDEFITDISSIIKVFDECIETECGKIRIYISNKWIPYEYARRNCITQDDESDDFELEEDLEEGSSSWESETSNSDLEATINDDVNAINDDENVIYDSKNIDNLEQGVYLKTDDMYYFDIDFTKNDHNKIFYRTFCLNDDANIVFGPIGNNLMIYSAIRYSDDVYVKPVFLHTMQRLMDLFNSINNFESPRKPVHLTFALIGTD